MRTTTTRTIWPNSGRGGCGPPRFCNVENMKQLLHIDIETYCNLDIKKVGVYRYAEDPSLEVVLFAYAWGEGEPVVVDCTGDTYPGESLPAGVWRALVDPEVVKIAHNATFEYECIRHYYGLDLELSQWFCTLVGAACLGLPLSLDQVSKVLGLSQQKDARGKALITYFCKPCKPTKSNGGRRRNRPEHALDKWAEFKEYNGQDVRTEQEIYRYLCRFPMPSEQERAYWVLDQLINSTGIRIDRELVEAAITANTDFTRTVHEELVRLTGIENPNSLPQLKRWIEEQTGEPVRSLNKDELGDTLKSEFLSGDVRRVLELRQLSSKTSVSKFDAMLSYACQDDRVRGLLQFYGANRTGRWAGRGVQVQNLKRTLKKGIDTAREAVRKGVVDLLYDDVPEVLSRLIRSALIAPEGCLLAVSDFSAIEARVIAWLAGEEWVLEVFRTHGKIYEATAANMFGVPIEMVTKGSALRDKGKVSTLALGYQGGTGALVKMGALRAGLEESELPALVRSWRSANPHIVKFWYDVERTAKHVVENKTGYILRRPHCSIRFSYDRGYLFVELPSGRRLAYYGATVDKGRLSYWGVDQTRKTWVKTETYGGSLVENITQAVARDCLAAAMLEMHRAGFRILMHIHDEVVVETPESVAAATLDKMNEIMRVSPVWADGLPLKGDGYVSPYYKKD